MADSEVVSFPSVDKPNDPFADAFQQNPTVPTRTNPRTMATGLQRGTQGLGGNKVMVGSSGETILMFDDDDRISAVFGFIPEVGTVPVIIIARSGYDVYKDILGINRPTGT